MKPWTDVVTPHDDILGGDLEMAVFAADLGSVVRQEGSVREVYGDPAAFFRSTYLTSSMRALLGDVLTALSGGGGDRVLQLRTPFGGGKTHTLLALYHVTTGRDRLALLDELEDLPDPGVTRVAVLSGVDLDPSSPRSHDGLVARTMWGELAWQLGGAEGYELVAAQDEAGQAPGKDALAKLFPAGESTLLLLDEVLVYVEKAKALQRGDSTLGAQVLVFLQALTELVGSHDRAAMVYSLQKSVLEAAGDESLLLALDHLVTRVDAKREPVTGDEVMRVVQRRLFSDLGSEEDRLDAARGHADLYRRYGRQLADTEEERRNVDAEAERLVDRIMASYPFHPALLDLMHQRWTTLPSYQRTRGALQFLAVVHGLWNSDRQALPLIGPGDVPYDDERVRGAFFSQVGDREGYTGVLERDFNGVNAKAKEVDRRMGGDVPRLRQLRIGTRVASATMLYSFGGQSEEQRGVLESELIGGLIGPDLDRNLLTTALTDLRDELLFLHHSGRRYWFDKKANLNQLLATEANRFTSEEVVDAVRKELERRIGASGTALLWPQHGGQIPDEEPVFRIAYLDPSWTGLVDGERGQRLRELFERRGSGSNRSYRNAIGFALPSADSIEHARHAARRVLAVRSLVKQAKSLNIAGEQLAELKERGEGAERDLVATLDRAYELVLLPVEAGEGGLLPYEFEEIDLSARIGLGRVVHDRVLEGLANHVFESVTPQKLVSLLRLGAERRWVACSEVIDAAFSYLQFPKLRSEAALREAIAAGAMKGVFGYVSTATADADGVHARPELVRVGKATGSDEVDLGEGAFLLERAYAHELAELPGAADEQGVPVDVGGASVGSLSVTDSSSGARVAKGRKLTMSFQVGKAELFDAMPVLAALSDESSEVDVSVTVSAKALESFDRTWVRNAIRERLEEAGINVEIVLGDD